MMAVDQPVLLEPLPFAMVGLTEASQRAARRYKARLPTGADRR